LSFESRARRKKEDRLNDDQNRRCTMRFLGSLASHFKNPPIAALPLPRRFPNVPSYAAESRRGAAPCSRRLLESGSDFLFTGDTKKGPLRRLQLLISTKRKGCIWIPRLHRIGEKSRHHFFRDLLMNWALQRSRIVSS
jgi:hypothetical protein